MVMMITVGYTTHTHTCIFDCVHVFYFEGVYLFCLRGAAPYSPFPALLIMKTHTCTHIQMHMFTYRRSYVLFWLAQQHMV